MCPRWYHFKNLLNHCMGEQFFMKLGGDEVILVPYKCCSVLSGSITCIICDKTFLWITKFWPCERASKLLFFQWGYQCFTYILLSWPSKILFECIPCDELNIRFETKLDNLQISLLMLTGVYNICSSQPCYIILGNSLESRGIMFDFEWFSEQGSFRVTDPFHASTSTQVLSPDWSH